MIPLLQECQVVTVSRNAYGDYVETGSVTEPCRFRQIPTVKRTTNAELNDNDGIFWLAPTTAAQEGSILKYDGIYYQVDRLTRARKLHDTIVRFIKAEVKVFDIFMIS